MRIKLFVLLFSFSALSYELEEERILKYAILANGFVFVALPVSLLSYALYFELVDICNWILSAASVLQPTQSDVQ